jgi:hypothetical protein
VTRPLVVLLVVWCCASHRQRCPAPPSWYVNGAQPRGSYQLAPVLGRAQDDLLDAWLQRELAGPAPVSGWLYCTGGATLYQDGLKAWCQRGD